LKPGASMMVWLRRHLTSRLVDDEEIARKQTVQGVGSDNAKRHTIRRVRTGKSVDDEQIFRWNLDLLPEAADTN